MFGLHARLNKLHQRSGARPKKTRFVLFWTCINPQLSKVFIYTLVRWMFRGEYGLRFPNFTSINMIYPVHWKHLKRKQPCLYELFYSLSIRFFSVILFRLWIIFRILQHIYLIFEQVMATVEIITSGEKNIFCLFFWSENLTKYC